MIWTKLKGYADAILGASWVDPFRSFKWGGETGGGDYYSPISFTATPKGPSETHLTGIAPTITNASQFRYVRAYNADHTLHSEYWPSRKHAFIWNATTSYLMVNGASWGSAAYLVVHIHAGHRAYAPTEDAYQGYSVNPEHAWTQQDDNVAATQGNGTTDYYWDMDMYKYAGLQILDTPGANGDQTYTFWGSWEDNGTAAAASDLTDMGTPWFGFASVTSAQITANPYAGVLEWNTPITFKYLRTRVIRANDGAATDGAWDMHMRGTY
ncbi:MAG: hypothetical protein V3W44_10780 [Dehalococcoidales bacterium]